MIAYAWTRVLFNGAFFWYYSELAWLAGVRK